ncbi:SIS domain-containing protein [Clostridium sp. Cult1]|uniref:SIS domain-containing protein n=1 Tax=Clostridium sp. Cult1 TaxID=2079002 RepID=UPI001F016263|nr:SIS domain-containing protein [Clostridium sp. Cult1]
MGNEGDIIVIVSNSGRNAVPVEMAMLAKEKGIYVIALTSLKHSQSVESRHESGKRLFELADLVIDMVYLQKTIKATGILWRILYLNI